MKENLFTCVLCLCAGVVTDLATVQRSHLFVNGWPCHCGHTTWEACSHKQVINIIVSHDISIQFKVLKILHEK